MRSCGRARRHRREDGLIEARTRDARQIVRMLGLNDREAREYRVLWMGIISLAKQHDPGLYHRLMRYPDDLPDLVRLRPPSGNLRTEGIASSALALRKEGKLPETY
ncbi:hypothetical protein HY285_05785 [Candidatus Peregrinibacteria bacterium]|nr:hypothetical protein [Candidatus Peregrinibacteria bacterium]MBI3817018.1 hypothetical protein [Candidatus Peregrinibacteria bacterium]